MFVRSRLSKRNGTLLPTHPMSFGLSLVGRKDFSGNSDAGHVDAFERVLSDGGDRKVIERAWNCDGNRSAESDISCYSNRAIINCIIKRI